jgi:hypothetical protein
MRRGAERKQKVERKEKEVGNGRVLNQKVERAVGNHVKRWAARDVNVCHWYSNFVMPLLSEIM